MSSFFAWLSTFLTGLIRTPLTHLVAFWVGKRVGRKEQQLEQQATDLDAISKATAARRAVKHDDVSVRDDPFNRDT